MFTREILLTVFLQHQKYIQENIKEQEKELWMKREKKYFQLEIFMKVTLKMTKKKEKGNFTI
jgi:hypothetical protein